jgi:hypothetical protein
VNGTIEVGGPQQFRFDEIIRRTLATLKDPRTVVTDPQARYFGALLDERSLVPGEEAWLGDLTLEEYIKGRAPAAPSVAAGR